MDLLVPAEDGHWINENHARIAELINEYDPTMELLWIPPEYRVKNSNEAPYAVRHNPPDKEPYIMFYIKEDELDHRVLARIYRGDTTKNDVQAMIESSDKAWNNLRTKIALEKAAERQDFIKTVVGSNKHQFKHNGKIIPL